MRKPSPVLRCWWGASKNRKNKKRKSLMFPFSSVWEATQRRCLAVAKLPVSPPQMDEALVFVGIFPHPDSSVNLVLMLAPLTQSPLWSHGAALNNAHSTSHVISADRLHHVRLLSSSGSPVSERRSLFRKSKYYFFKKNKALHFSALVV